MTRKLYSFLLCCLVSKSHHLTCGDLGHSGQENFNPLLFNITTISSLQITVKV